MIVVCVESEHFAQSVRVCTIDKLFVDVVWPLKSEANSNQSDMTGIWAVFVCMLAFLSLLYEP